MTLRRPGSAVAGYEADHEADRQPAERGHREGEPRVRIDAESVRKVVPEHRLQPVLGPEEEQRHRRSQHPEDPAKPTSSRYSLLRKFTGAEACSASSVP